MTFILLALAMSVGAASTETPNLDAVVAAPGNHKIMLENDQVRVLQVEVAPGETERSTNTAGRAFFIFNQPSRRSTSDM